ncbi:hypothetical protein Tco_0468514 [Tanacetum coccineum]
MCNIATRSYYIGCLRAIGGTSDFRDPNTRQGIRRKIEIENLNFKARYEDSPPLIICKLPYQDVQQEKIRNRFPLKTIMEQNPNSYKDVSQTPLQPPLSLSSLQADKVTDHPCTELVEKYKPADPKKILPEILAVQGKSGVFQFHLNTLGNFTDLTLDAVFDLKKQDESTVTSALEPSKGDEASLKMLKIYQNNNASLLEY